MTDERLVNGPVASRRVLFAGAGAIGAGAVLAACGDGDSADDPGYGAPGDDPPAGGGDNGPGQQDGGTEPGQGDGGGGDVLATTDEVTVGGGVVLRDEQVVVTQPTEGTFRGFSAVCTHQGCVVSNISDGEIVCGCHGSRYSVEDGSVLAGANGADPSSQDPLPEVPLSVDGDRIARA